MSGSAVTLPTVSVTAQRPTSAPPAKPSFVIRILKVVFTWIDGTQYTFDGTPVSTTPFVSGLQIEADLEQVLLPSAGGSAYIRVFGMTLSQMNQLSIAGTVWRLGSTASVQLYAGDSTSQVLTLIHAGPVIEAHPEFRDMPSSPFFISSVPGALAQMNNTVTGTSFRGAVSAQTFLQQVCGKVGITLNYNGPAVMLSNHHASGSAWDQIEDVIYAAQLRSYYDGRTSTLYVYPQTGSLPGTVATISPQNGMIGYPDFQSNLVTVRTIFDPAIATAVRGPGRQVQIESQLKAATGTFIVNQMSYNLSCNDPDGGPWEMTIGAYPANVGASGDP